MIKINEIAEIFEELTHINFQNTNAELQSLILLNEVINRFFVIITRDERIVFHTAFARIAFAQHKYRLPRRHIYAIHQIRRSADTYHKQGMQLEIGKDELHLLIRSGLKGILELFVHVFDRELPADLETTRLIQYPKSKERQKIKQFRASEKVIVLEIDKESELMIAHPFSEPDTEIKIRFNIPDRNENFTESLQMFMEHGTFPVVMQLEGVEIDQNNIRRPLAFVVEPDYLLDVTSVAERSKDYQDESILYLMRRFLPRPSSTALVLGNITNFFLDELMMDHTLQFEDLFHRVFQQNPLAFTMFTDQEVREIFQSSKLHFFNLKSAITKEFKSKNIQWNDCYLEPSFYSPEYGLQGRLDIYHENPKEEDRPTIIELKSGKIWRPNRHGLNQSHYAQTLLYDLMITASYGRNINPVSYILYSAEPQNQLKYAPKTKAYQYEVLNVRNKLIALERALRNIKSAHALFSKITTDHFEKSNGFVRRDIEAFQKFYANLSRLEKAYFLLFVKFISLEQSIAKIGVQQFNNINGQAALWLDSYQKKDSEFNILAYLKILENQTTKADPLIRLMRTDQTNVLANFRVGDIAILYPFLGTDESPIQNQVFKCTIVDLDHKSVVIRLRSKQFNLRVFDRHEFWNIEHDLIDSSFLGLYRSLSAFLQRGDRSRRLLFTTEPPAKPGISPNLNPSGMTDEQARIFNKAIAAKDYFLIWGPPGTGKTSVMVKELTKYYLEHTPFNILLLAYTNRAVDEMCAAVESISDQLPYIRIGSRYSTSPRYRDRLFNNMIRETRRRSEVKKMIDDHRIFTATISSFSSKDELLRLKKFDIVIIDEASQVIEPQIVGILSKFKKFILIGDHNQLPAVVQQDIEVSAVELPLLNDIGLINLRNSLFERLYKRCQRNEWIWAYDILSHQGRMHKELMVFPNKRFYNDKLDLLPANITYRERQERATLVQYEGKDKLLSRLATERLVFIDTPIDDTNTNLKTNSYEADKVVQLIMALKKLYLKKELDPSKVGVITPYRAQIAAIREQLFQHDLDPQGLSIDTVERYQGGARDIIILSLSQNSKSQMYSLSTPSDEGIDRKLNVALTRAREQLILIGNEKILSTIPVYRDLILWMKGEKQL
ncbi:MAG: AAA family ATPase [Bacteroidia bacterium]|nr:AAA family ATPase [Bacteroidia bacterium]